MTIARNALYFEDYVLSIQYFNQVINAKPYLYEPYFFRGLAKINLDDYQGAESDCDAAIQRNPFVVGAYQIRGLARIRQNKFDEAIEDYKTAIKYDPENVVLWHNLSLCHIQKEDYEAAKEDLGTLLTIAPKYTRAYLMRGEVSLKQNDTIQALRDFDKAIEFLREKGLATAEKKAGRIAAEGLVATTIKDGDKVAAIVEVNAETDFVAKNEVFQTFVKEVVEQAANTDAADIDAFKAEKWALDTSMTVDEKLAAMIAKIGENMNIRRFEKIVSEDGIVVSYIHAAGKIGVLVEAKTENNDERVKEALKNVAMQVAALNPKYVSTDDVPEEYKEHEKEILIAQAKNDPKNANKPENIIEKMITGRLAKELKEICLLEQEYVKAENKETVAKYLEMVSKEVGTPVELKRFVRFETGEGLEKKNEDFAAEVAAQMNA